MISLRYNLVKPYVIETSFNDIRMEGSHHLIVKPCKLSICKADMRYYFGLRDAKVLSERLPMALIHEASGKVLFDPSGIYKKGTKVVLLPNIGGKDEFYNENYRLDSVFRSSKADGFMQETVRMRHEHVVPYPDDLPDEILCFTEFLSVGVHAVESFDKISHSRKQNIGVWGDGALSYVICCILKNKYPDVRITVIGVSPSKLQYFTFVDNILTVDQVDRTIQFDHAFECVGGQGSGKAVGQMIDTLNPQAVIMLLGVSEEPVPINTRMVLEKGITLLGRSRSGKNDFERAVDILKNDKIFLGRMKHLISEQIDINNLDDINKAFSLAKISDFKVVMNWNI